MNYIIYDLEFNQRYPKEMEPISNNINTYPFEIIQIGAIKLNESLEIIDTFNSLIKPTMYPIIHPFIEELTNITNSKVSSCKLFKEVYNDFLNFIGTDDNVFCVWGTTDLKELFKTLEFYDIPYNLGPEKYIDIQSYASRYFNIPSGSKIGLKNATALLNIENPLEFHDAFNDAYYTAKIFMKIYNNDIRPAYYTYKK
ncbi:Exonuclease family protein [Clostridium bornimense]|uniref:Exonuclease family protein n=1 Tax=Clostridium bornimense TaxID=1216932 RepID=W6S3Y2_9CLOT|nr:3'-5' exonuclease [Clostridium bornimense]CDM69027.1 Exonuclease family protein [Clostridium bornimense]